MPWIKEFINQAAQEHFWEPRTMSMMVLSLRTAIEVCALALPDVKRAASEWQAIPSSLIVQKSPG